jgi:hypothetical protein
MFVSTLWARQGLVADPCVVPMTPATHSGLWYVGGWTLCSECSVLNELWDFTSTHKFDLISIARLEESDNSQVVGLLVGLV